MAQETGIFLHEELGNTEVWVNRESHFRDCWTLDPDSRSQSLSQTPESFPFKPSPLLHPPESFWTLEMRALRERSLSRAQRLPLPPGPWPPLQLPGPQRPSMLFTPGHLAKAGHQSSSEVRPE